MFDPSTLTAIALKTGLLFFAVALIARAMPRRSAAWRHFLWSCTSALSLLMPFAVVYLPSFVQIPLPWESAEPWTRDASDFAAAGGARRGAAKPDIVDANPVALDARRSGPATAEHPAGAARPTALIIWLAGALGVLLRNVLAHVGLIRWVREARSDLSPAWAETLRRVAGDANFRKRLRVLESDHGGPCTWGFLRPVVLVPAAGAGWSEPQRRFALLHELAHVRRFDYLTTQISNLACAMHWYNPLAWFAAAQARRLQEHACDDAVLQGGGMPSEYAQFLVSIAGGSRRLSLALPAAVGMVRRSQLHGRVTAILDASRARLPLSGMALVVALVPLACLMLLLATLSAAASPRSTQAGVPLAAPFNSVELRNGGNVNLVQGSTHRVTLLRGDPEESGIAIRNDGRLVIDRCPKHCPRGHDFEVEVVTPGVTAIAVADGGTIQSRGDFPPQPEISVAVSQGGTIDIRSMAVASVAASVEGGGRIFVKPAAALSASVEQGGNVTYWGDAAVKSSVRHGGAVVKGVPADAGKLLAQLVGPAFAPPLSPPAPPVSAIHPASR